MPELSISDTRMLRLVDITIKAGVVKNEAEYFRNIGFEKANISNVRAGRQSFTRNHIYAACEFTGASADWVFGFTNKIYRKEAQSLKERLRAILEEMK